MIAIIIAARKRVIDEIVMVSLVTIASGFHIRYLIAYFMPHATLSSTPCIWCDGTRGEREGCHCGDATFILQDVQANVVRVGLQLAGQPPLIPVEVAGIWPDPTRVRTSCPVYLTARMWQLQEHEPLYARMGRYKGQLA
jgi:hypothetical protein